MTDHWRLTQALTALHAARQSALEIDPDMPADAFGLSPELAPELETVEAAIRSTIASAITADAMTTTGTGIAGAAANAQVAVMTCATCGKEMEAPRVVQVQDKLRMWCSQACVTPDPRDVLAAQMAAWVRQMGHWTTLGDDAVVLAVASPEPAERVCITVGMIREAARCEL